MTPSNNLTLFYQNVQSYALLSIFNNLLNFDFDIVLVMVTWLQGDILDGELCDFRYGIFRSDYDLR